MIVEAIRDELAPAAAELSSAINRSAALSRGCGVAQRLTAGMVGAGVSAFVAGSPLGALPGLSAVGATAVFESLASHVSGSAGALRAHYALFGDETAGDVERDAYV